VAGSWSAVTRRNINIGKFLKDRFIEVVEATFTGDASTGAVPDLVIPGGLYGFCVKVLTNPGAVAPTDNYDLTCIGDDGEDLFCGAGIDRDTANTEQFAPVISGGATPAPMGGGATLKIANQSVASATGKVQIWLSE
jgi:hypothetical protein